MARHMHWQHRHHHHWHRPMSMPRNPFGMFLGIAFGFMMLSFLFKSGLIFFVVLLGGLMLIKGASSMGNMVCRNAPHDDDADEDIESYLKRKNDDLYGDDKRKNDDDVVYF